MPNIILSFKQICLDFFLLLSIGISVPLIKKFGTTSQRGFFCNDENLLYPSNKTRFENKYFHIIWISCMCLTIIVIEFFRRSNTSKKAELLQFKIPIWCCKMFQSFSTFIFGLFCSMFTTTATKSLIGALRPHFLALCAPNIDCSLPHNQHVYHTIFNCTANLDRPDLLRNARLSFPSGHSSFAMYCAVFFVIYFEKQVTRNEAMLLKCVIQFLVLFLALFEGFSRVADYYHHMSDVLGGFVLGAVCAVCAALNRRTLIFSDD